LGFQCDFKLLIGWNHKDFDLTAGSADFSDSASRLCISHRVNLYSEFFQVSAAAVAVIYRLLDMAEFPFSDS
jgi:hypothetical protein